MNIPYKIMPYDPDAENEVVSIGPREMLVKDTSFETVDFVFDGPPGPESGRFIEVETADGASVSVGEWIKRDDGYWVLRVDAFVRGRNE